MCRCCGAPLLLVIFSGKEKNHLAPTAEIVLQQTWAYNENDKRYGPESSIGTKPEEMFAKLEKNYADFSARYGNLRVIRTRSCARDAAAK